MARHTAPVSAGSVKTRMAWMAAVNDLGGTTPRIADMEKGGIVDLGAYEFFSRGTLLLLR